MKTKIGFMKGVLAIAMALILTTGVVYADGGSTDVYAKGSTYTPAGDYVVQSTNDIFHFQGEVYEVFNVYYDDPAMNLKIAVNPGDKCSSFIAFTNDYTVFYKCGKQGFGVRKIMFANPEAQKRFDCVEYQKQTVLRKQHKIEKKDAVSIIASFLPGMQTA
jgi:hypothetical protein